MPQNKTEGENVLLQHYQERSQGYAWADLQMGQWSGILTFLRMFKVLLIQEDWIAILLC